MYFRKKTGKCYRLTKDVKMCPKATNKKPLSLLALSLCSVFKHIIWDVSSQGIWHNRSLNECVVLNGRQERIKTHYTKAALKIIQNYLFFQTLIHYTATKVDIKNFCVRLTEPIAKV